MDGKKYGEFDLLKRNDSMYGDNYYEFYDAEEDKICHFFIDDEI